MTSTIRIAALAMCLLSAGTASAIDLGGMLGAGKDLAKAATISDKDVIEGSRLMMRQMDKEEKVAPAGSKYAKRLAMLTKGLENEDGLKLNFAVYQSSEVNAFATPDGSIRIYAGLMDLMNDDELRGVIGHEIGHTKLGHSASQMKKALLLSAGTKAAGASGNQIGGMVAANEETIKAFGNAQFSQSDETSSDDYGFKFMQKHKYDVRAMESAFRKLAKQEQGEGSMMASHPGSNSRADRMKAAADKL
ncbi:M48 family metalloprotease [Massilia pseudoviolaceinigra]|uniref:M48 family metalloprotease n=1 Tax=Massilia pseudoviolaceinigra TaxID=3057165 RepID=UPI00279655DF|nr:M48 family metalloprotease [Massilia sp. CCM 9206]MDQ1921392.1 M48 family metalloprotease [Massilia sp. CCM 9206]